MKAVTEFHNRLFRWFLKHQLIYPSCWEDPRVDRLALKISPADTVLTITSGGCNVLDYALDHPSHIYAVDLNYRQNALLELKLAAIRNLDFELFFQLFGRGYCADARRIYKEKLRPDLVAISRQYWDRCIDQFASRRGSFYFHGGMGTGSHWTNRYIDYGLRLRPAINRLFEVETTQEQVRIYREELRPSFWRWPVRAMMNSRLLLASVGIPAAQREIAKQELSRAQIQDVATYLDHCAEKVLSKFLLRDNYFWHVYLRGNYSLDCCPNYLKPESYEQLRQGPIDRISIHTNSLQKFLGEQARGGSPPITRFSLLDHMDWFSGDERAELRDHCQAIVDHASPGSRFVWRSMASDSDPIDRIKIAHQGRKITMGSLLSYDTELAHSLREQQRVNTYAGFFVATL
jgi:S-adenosylmethionine-diacylglycerol 3-amino-3-carboxypropyl transferase